MPEHTRSPHSALPQASIRCPSFIHQTTPTTRKLEPKVSKSTETLTLTLTWEGRLGLTDDTGWLVSQHDALTQLPATARGLPEAWREVTTVHHIACTVLHQVPCAPVSVYTCETSCSLLCPRAVSFVVNWLSCCPATCKVRKENQGQRALGLRGAACRDGRR